jgi:hypothetical protein
VTEVSPILRGRAFVTGWERSWGQVARIVNPTVFVACASLGSRLLTVAWRTLCASWQTTHAKLTVTFLKSITFSDQKKLLRWIQWNRETTKMEWNSGTKAKSLSVDVTEYKLLAIVLRSADCRLNRLHKPESISILPNVREMDIT